MKYFHNSFLSIQFILILDSQASSHIFLGSFMIFLMPDDFLTPNSGNAICTDGSSLHRLGFTVDPSWGAYCQQILTVHKHLFWTV